MRTILIALMGLIIAGSASGQIIFEKEKKEPSGFDRKFHAGLTVSQYWSTISGSSISYFSKPSLGALVSVEYYPLSFLGIGLGAGYQQRGAGVSHRVAQIFAPDSAYRERLRFNTLEFPVSIFLRTPKDILRGLRLSGSLAVVPLINLHSHDVLNIQEPSIGNTDIVKDVSVAYFTNDMTFQFSIGP